MSTNHCDFLSNISVDAPLGYQKLRLWPLRFNRESDLQYLTLDDAVREKQVAIEEVSAAGSVPSLLIRNLGNHLLLIVDGSTLVGAKQNRVVNLSMMLAPSSVTEIPVSCVERGRWSFQTPHFAPGCISDNGLRGKMCLGTTDSLRDKKKVAMDQGAVWGHVEGMLGAFKAASPTRAYHAIHEKMDRDLKDCETHLPFPEHACGVAVQIDGTVRAVDLFDKPSTLRQLWPRLVKSYYLSSLKNGFPSRSENDVKTFLKHAFASKQESYESVGIGTTMRLTNAEIAGAALICEDQLVHLSLFAKEKEKTHGSESAQTFHPQNQIHDAGQGVSRRAWWRFWA
jgi:hypothetical protein